MPLFGRRDGAGQTSKNRRRPDRIAARSEMRTCVELAKKGTNFRFHLPLRKEPRYLRTHVNQWDTARLEALKADALSPAGLRQRLRTRPQGSWSPLQRNLLPLTTRISTRGLSDPAPHVLDDDQASRDQRIMQALRSVPLNRSNTGTLPPTVWPILRDELPRGGLRSWLKRFPANFEVIKDRPLTWRRIA